MNSAIPAVADVRTALEPLNMRQLRALERLSGVPFNTLYKIQRGETANPGIETVRLFLPHVRAARRIVKARKAD